MKKEYKQKREQGFTIIEVLIVLAIAALILLIVFLAVPALQRNARNTQRKSDAANIAAAIGNFAGNNNGALPTASGYDPSDVATWLFYCNGAATLSGGVTPTAGRNVAYASASCNQATNKNFESSKAGYYKPADNNVWWNNVSGGSINVVATGSESTTGVSKNSIIVDLGYSCNADSNNAGTTSNSRSYAVLYVQESSAGIGNLQCVGS
jgi:prepilin-type N-terminal cleavage/methylation domain-containing protein